jgi:hypothetical protein
MHTVTDIPTLAEMLSIGHEVRQKQWRSELIIMEANSRLMQLSQGLESVGHLITQSNDCNEQIAHGVGCLLIEVGSLMSQLTCTIEEARAGGQSLLSD